MGLFSDKDKTKRLAKVYGVTPEGVQAAVAKEQRVRDVNSAFFEGNIARLDAHTAGKHCGHDCNVCRQAGHTR